MNNSNENLLPDAGDNDRLTTARITMRVPQNYHKEPIISRLVSDHGLTVNIVAAILGENAKEDGWFNLELEGTSHQIQSALVYLEELDLEIWDKSASDDDTW
ncbi:NIL domain-containing protein [Synechococcus sp. PCC 7502]|uniref:NIL domain-containing protein n=1 Tax=Synechococcus sp. PCC 7502 TaxID=1173263 RepID=UPI00029FDDC8|nr:NIL domain-containing protein [Synechococcus sp. PCC 7502]AFY73882.1 NIL domain-containing protein [Synechococcus sp. PCC 7502]